MNDSIVSERLKIETDDADKMVYASIITSKTSFEYSEQWLEQQLAQQGCVGLCINEATHKQLAELLNKKQAGKIKLGQKINAKVEAVLSSDIVSASLRITSAKGGMQAGTKAIVAALNDKEIDLDLVDKKIIVSLVRKSLNIAPGETIATVIARGEPPIHGKDTQFECLLDNITDRKPHKRDDGTLDYYDLGELICVAETTQLMKKCAPTSAKNGRSVTGHELPARIGKPLKFKKCKGAEISPTDPNLLIASIKGQPSITTNGVSVDSIYTVKNVDLHTGHIEYDGSVIVKGDVVSGMKIKVPGDVQIFGMVENAQIEASGNIDIKLGAIGHVATQKSDALMKISCGGNLSAGYLENAVVDVQGDILIKSRISNCDVKANHQIIVGNHQQAKSGIVGGQVMAGSIIRAEVLGSSGDALTHVGIECGSDILEKLASIEHETVEHDKLLMTKLGKMVSLSKKHTEEAKQALHDLKNETEALKATIHALFLQKGEIESAIEQASTGKVIVQKEAHPGVTIKIFDHEQNIKSRYGQGTFKLNNGVFAFETGL
ncbi:MAG: hypothetical protein methR_P0296 [Methyloprofundus sp.]|nr:MAG: hypothetical protein methR_P0296 [Methyloprofundus sp.]